MGIDTSGVFATETKKLSTSENPRSRFLHVDLCQNQWPSLDDYSRSYVTRPLLNEISRTHVDDPHVDTIHAYGHASFAPVAWLGRRSPRPTTDFNRACHYASVHVSIVCHR